MTPVLEVRGVTKAYGDVPVLRGIDLSVDEHHVVALIGASGSGKSTLLRCIDLLEEIDDGDILFDGEEITDPAVDPVGGAPPARDGLPGLQPVPAHDRARQPHARRRGACTACARRGRGRGRATCSRGSGSAGREDDQPRPALRRPAAAGRDRPRVRRPPAPLLLDEITSALDPELVGEVLDIVRELKAEGMTMVLATHEMGFAREVADEVCFLHDGLILERGAPDAVLGAPKQPETQRFLSRLLDARRI